MIEDDLNKELTKGAKKYDINRAVTQLNKRNISLTNPRKKAVRIKIKVKTTKTKSRINTIKTYL